MKAAKVKLSGPADMRIDYMPLSELRRAPRNPKAHAQGALGASIDRFGFVQPLLIDDRTSTLVAGHGRLDNLAERKRTGAPPPNRVLVRADGEWMIPVTRGVKFTDDREAEAYLLADNRIPEIGGWNDDELAKMMGEIAALGNESLTGLGWTKDDVSSMLDNIDKGTGGNDLDDVPDLAPEPYVKLGDVWACGDHRVICGSCEHLSDLVELKAAALLITDPPYGVSYADKNKFLMEMSGRGNSVQKPIENDHHSPEEMGRLWTQWFSAVRPLMRDGGAYYVTGPSGDLFLSLLLSLRASGFPLRHTLIWAKNSLVFGRSDYHYQHEPIIYGWVEGAGHHQVENRSETSLWEIPRPSKSELHPTMKPVALYERAMKNSSFRGELVLDAFLGSGTCLIAGEQTERRVVGSEIDPCYAQVCIERWQKLTGKKAEKIKGASNV